MATKKAVSEHTIKKSVMDFLKKIQVSTNGRLVARKTHGTAFSTAGDPDIIGCYLGSMFVIELKKQGENPTKIQEARLLEWRRAGALSGIARSVNDVRALLWGWFTIETPPPEK
jgi:Holliday junction resolvase